jgi:hypothetical protein
MLQNLWYQQDNSNFDIVIYGLFKTDFLNGIRLKFSLMINKLNGLVKID